MKMEQTSLRRSFLSGALSAGLCDEAIRLALGWRRSDSVGSLVGPPGLEPGTNGLWGHGV